MGSIDFWAFSRLAESSQQRNEESGHINEFETIFSLLMQRQLGRELKWDLLFFWLFQGSQNLCNNESGHIDEFDTIFSLIIQRLFGRELKWDLLIFGLFQGSQNLRNNATRNQDILMNLRQYSHF